MTERRWIQIELIGPRHYSLLVSADLGRDPGMIRNALQSWMIGDWTAESRRCRVCRFTTPPSACAPTADPTMAAVWS